MMAAEASLEREKTPSRLPPAAPSGRTPPPGGAEPPPTGKKAVCSFRVVFVRFGGLLGEVCVRVLAEQFLLLQLAAPGVASRPGGPLEVLLPPVGQFVAMKGGPVPVADPPPHRTHETAVRRHQRAAQAQTAHRGRRPMPAARDRIVARSAVAGPARTRSLAERDGFRFVMGRASGIVRKGIAGAARPLRPGYRAPSRPGSAFRRRGAWGRRAMNAPAPGRWKPDIENPCKRAVIDLFRLGAGGADSRLHPG